MILLLNHLNQFSWIAADDGIGGHIFRDHSCGTFSFYFVSVLLSPHAGYSLVIHIANNNKRTRVHVYARLLFELCCVFLFISKFIPYFLQLFIIQPEVTRESHSFRLES